MSKSDSLPPLTIRHGEGVETDSVFSRAYEYCDRGLSGRDAVSKAARDALGALSRVDGGKPVTQNDIDD